MKKTQCNRCEHLWYKRTPKDPKVCPNCKSPYWNKERVYNLTTNKTPEVYSERI